MQLGIGYFPCFSIYVKNKKGWILLSCLTSHSCLNLINLHPLFSVWFQSYQSNGKLAEILTQEKIKTVLKVCFNLDVVITMKHYKLISVLHLQFLWNWSKPRTENSITDNSKKGVNRYLWRSITRRKVLKKGANRVIAHKDGSIGEDGWFGTNRVIDDFGNRDNRTWFWEGN